MSSAVSAAVCSAMAVVTVSRVQSSGALCRIPEQLYFPLGLLCLCVFLASACEIFKCIFGGNKK